MSTFEVLQHSLKSPDELPFRDARFEEAYTDVILGAIDYQDLLQNPSTLEQLEEQVKEIEEGVSRMQQRVDDFKLSSESMPDRGSFLSACATTFSARSVAMRARTELIVSHTRNMKAVSSHLQSSLKKLDDQIRD